MDSGFRRNDGKSDAPRIGQQVAYNRLKERRAH